MTEPSIDEPLGRPQTSRAYAVLGLGVLAVSLAAIFIRLAQDENVPSVLIAGGRLFIAALLLTPVVFRQPKYVAQIRTTSRLDVALIFTGGFFLAVHFVTWVTSLEYTTVLISVVLVTTTPIWVALLEVFVLKAQLSRPIIAGLVIALIGGALIGLSGGDATTQIGGNDQILGALLSIVGAMAVAVYLVVGRRLRRTLALTPYIWMVYGVAGTLVVLLALVTDTAFSGYSLKGYLWVLVCALVPQLVGHTSLNYALAYLPATYVSLSTQLEPIMSALFAYMMFQEVPTWLSAVGGLVIVVGVTLATLGQANAKR